MIKPIENYNSDNILVRNVIAGILSIFNKSIKYEQTWENNITEEVTLPWIYDLGSSDERLMQDNYTFFGQSCFAKKIDGNFDMFPRGAIRLNSTTIDSDNICNRFVQGLTTRIEDGKVKTYHSFLYSIPLTINFDCEVWCDSFTNMLKIEQSIREYLYRNKTFYILFRGMRIGCCLGMPNDYNEQKNTEYSLSSETGEQKIKLTFSIAVETYQPVYDRGMETPNEKRMLGIAYDVNIKQLNDNNKTIKLYCDDILISNTNTYIKWDYNSLHSDMCTVNLEYRQIKDKDGNIIENSEYIPIEVGLANQSDYYWKVPNINTIQNIDIIYNIDDIKMIKEPIIKIASNNILDSNAFIIVDPGYFITTSDNGISSVPFSIGYMDNDEYKIVDNYGHFNLIWSKIDITNPCEVYTPIQYNNKDLSEYEIRISDGINQKIYDIKSNIKIF